MLVVGFPATMFATNCFVLATGAGQECVVVDPGIGIEPQLDDVLREHRLQPVAVLLTHGHLDHTFSVTPVCGARGIPAYIHADDRYRLDDPVSTLGPQLTEMFAGRLEWTEPDDVRELTDGATIDLAGLSFVADHAPGHTEGSVMFRLAAAGDDPPLCVSGDVLFAGSIGRTDLPGGDHRRDAALAADQGAAPGRRDGGAARARPTTTIGRERATNPFLAEVAPAAGPRRGV